MGKTHTIAEKRRKMILVNPKTVLFWVLLLHVYLSEGTESVNSISFTEKSKPQESKPKVVHVWIEDRVGRASCSIWPAREEEGNPDTFLMTDFKKKMRQGYQTSRK